MTWSHGEFIKSPRTILDIKKLGAPVNFQRHAALVGHGALKVRLLVIVKNWTD